jgi:hypothetical protein
MALAVLLGTGIGSVLRTASAAPSVEAVAYDSGGVAVSTPPGAPRQMVRGSQPAVSPDGSQLAWVAGVAGHPHIFVGALDGSGARQVTAGAAYDAAPSWSRDGTRLAYERVLPADAANALWVVGADGSDNHAVGVAGAGPVWSPDGRFLAFNDGAGNLAVVRPDGLGMARIGVGVSVWDWSSDGTRLAVSTRSNRGASIYRLGDRTSTAALLGSDVDYYDRPQFSASGTQLYVNHQHAEGKDNLTSAVERWSVEGVRDTTFSPQPMDFGGRISDGGGVRPAPEVTSPAPVADLTATPSASEVRLDFTLPSATATAGVTIRYAVGATPPATVTDGLDAGDTLGRTITVARLARSTTYSFGVFTRDWSGAASPAATAIATTPPDVATTVTLTGPGTTTYGQAATLSGTLVRGDTGAGIPGAQLVLLGHHTGQPDARLATLTTDAAGHFTTTRATSEGTRYTVRFAGAEPLDPAVAGTLVQVRQRITIVFSPGPRVAAHHVATVTVTVAPAFPGGHVRVRQHLYEGGVDVLTRLDRRSRATVRLDTSRQQAQAFQNVVVTPGARSGYLVDPAFGTFLVA